MGKIIITQLNESNLLFLFNDDHELINLKCINTSIVDDVYIGKVEQINEGLKAAFVQVSPEIKAFLPLDNFKNGIPKCGTELPVQIKSDYIKSKLPTAGTDIAIPGSLCVLHLDGEGISVSKKLDVQTREKLLASVTENSFEGAEEFRWVIRTNAGELADSSVEPLILEMKELYKVGKKIKDLSEHMCLYSKLFSHESEVLKAVFEIPFSDYDTIITDNVSFYNDLKECGLLPSDILVKLYEDPYITLKNLHSLETYLNRALDSKVYLDCGGYIIIEPTEALTVIDVNSGKAEGRRKDTESFLYKINKEAAFEIARQLKLRNLSGIIIVDFINMKSKKDKDSLIEILNNEFKKDRVLTQCVDITPLGLVEITRKKISASLNQFIT